MSHIKRFGNIMRNVLTIAIIFIQLASFAQNTISDNSYLDESFIEFKIKLENSILKKDSQKLEELLYDRILDCCDSFDCAGFDGCKKSDFIKIFFGDSNSLHWNKLKQIVRYGFLRMKDTVKYKHIITSRDSLIFRAPFYSLRPKEVMILAENLNVRNEPSFNSRILSSVFFNKYICYTDENGLAKIYNDDWIKLKLPNDSYGFVLKEYTSEEVDRTLKVAKINGEWKIIEYFCDLNI